jgi:hypothetical protein
MIGIRRNAGRLIILLNIRPGIGLIYFPPRYVTLSLKFSLTDEFYEEETTAPKGRKGDDGGADETAEGPGHQTSLAFMYLRFESFEQQLDLQPGSETRMCYKMVICDVGLAEMGSSFPFCI